MDESGSTNNKIGLYRHKEAGTFIGALDDTQANSFVERGYELYKPGKEAAEMTDADINKMSGKTKAQQSTSDGQAMDATDTAEEAVQRIPNENLVNPEARPSTPVLSKAENKKADDAKKELSGEPQSAVEQLETAMDEDLGSGKKSK